MKNQYVGDINDYKKYTLIEIISKALNEKILITWMLTMDDGRNDGNKLDYLNNNKNESQINPELFEKLKSINKFDRGIKDIQNILKDKYKFYSDPLNDDKVDRKEYFDGLQKETEEIELVFFDPDNGIEVESVKYGNKNSSKYLYWDEIKQFSEMGKDILIYQHFPRKKRKTYIDNLSKEIGKRTDKKVLSIPTENVLFLLLTGKDDKFDEIKKKCESKGLYKSYT